MKNLINNIFTAICLVSLTANLNACGKVEMPVMPDTQFTATNLDQAPVSNQVLIKFKSGLTKNNIESFHSKYGTKILRIIPGINVYVVETPVDIRAEQLVRFLENDPMVKYAEVNTAIQLNPDAEVNPVYTINPVINYEKMIGKQLDINGVYKSSRSGAIISTKDGNLSIVDLDGTVVINLPGMAESSKVIITGIIKKVKGFNLTNNVGIMPVSFNK